MNTCLLITTYNRTPLLRKSLERLAELTLPDELLVVDDGGDDGCMATVADFRADLPARYIYTHNPGQQLCSHARNVGLTHTDCDVLIHSEPELLFKTDVVAQFLQRLEEVPDKVITAGTIFSEYGDGHFEKKVGWAASFAAAYRRQWLLDVGGWDEEFPIPYGYDDVDLATRIRIKLGVNQHVDPEIEAVHQWHEPGWYHTQDEVYMNWNHFRAKGFIEHERPTDPDLVANVGNAEWGVPRFRG